MPRGAKQAAAFAARLAEYTRLRLEGTDRFDAAAAIGVTNPPTAFRYERWFAAEHPELADLRRKDARWGSQ